MNDLRVIEGGGWYTATLASLPLIAGYGKTSDEAIERLRLELAALEYRLSDELDRVRAARMTWAERQEP